jgi:hypothetical protein
MARSQLSTLADKFTLEPWAIDSADPQNGGAVIDPPYADRQSTPAINPAIDRSSSIAGQCKRDGQYAAVDECNAHHVVIEVHCLSQSRSR